MARMGNDLSGMMWGAAVFAFLVWRWRWADPRAAAEILRGPDRTPGSHEPCWTEQVKSDGRYSYGRYGCFHEELREADAREYYKGD